MYSFTYVRTQSYNNRRIVFLRFIYRLLYSFLYCDLCMYFHHSFFLLFFIMRAVVLLNSCCCVSFHRFAVSITTYIHTYKTNTHRDINIAHSSHYRNLKCIEHFFFFFLVCLFLSLFSCRSFSLRFISCIVNCEHETLSTH